MKVEHINAGPKIAYTASEDSITFGERDLTINLKKRQKDEESMLDICADADGFLVIGAATGMRYVAQIKIPAKVYTGPEIEGEERILEPFSADQCTLYLWAIGGDAE